MEALPLRKRLLHAFVFTGKLGLSSVLEDPLIISLVVDLVLEQGIDDLESFSHKDQKAHFLSYLVCCPGNTFT